MNTFYKIVPALAGLFNNGTSTPALQENRVLRKKIDVSTPDSASVSKSNHEASGTPRKRSLLQKVRESLKPKKTARIIAASSIPGLVIAAMATLPILATNPKNNQETWPKSTRSPVVYSVHCILNNYYSPDADKLAMGVLFDYQVGANDCVYWWGYHYDWGWGEEHMPRGINSYTGYAWWNWGEGYDEYEVTVVRESNGDGFASGTEESVITFTGGDDWALVEPSDDQVPDWAPPAGSPDVFDSTTYYVPVTYNTTIYLGE